MKLQQQICRFWTLDPVHIGIGQENRGEVDLPISREAETRVPDMPGSTLKGMFRAHADWKLKSQGKKTAWCPGQKPLADDEEPQDGQTNDCGVSQCPICQTFGYPAGKYRDKANKIQNRQGREGRVFFKAGRLAFFPAATNRGICWFSTPGRAAAYLDLGKQLSDDLFYQRFPELLFGQSENIGLALNSKISEIRVGWFSLSQLKCESDNPLEQTLLKHISGNKLPPFPSAQLWEGIVKHTILVDETNFSRIVDSCLERRTRNKIDELTGTVKTGALFNYEALPRYSLLYARLEWQEWSSGQKEIFQDYPSPLDVCALADEGLARMGIGGMQTTGLGGVLLESFTGKSGA